MHDIILYCTKELIHNIIIYALRPTHSIIKSYKIWKVLIYCWKKKKQKCVYLKYVK